VSFKFPALSILFSLSGYGFKPQSSRSAVSLGLISPRVLQVCPKTGGRETYSRDMFAAET